MTLLIQDLGQMDYTAAWQLQNDLAAQIADGTRPATLLLVEHPHTYTFGRRGQAANLLWSAAKCARRGVSVHWVDRGGDITYHGPGQLVGYPLLRLTPPAMNSSAPHADYVGYVRRLEKMLILALTQFGLAAGQLAGHSGVWIQPEIAPAGRNQPAKIAAIGVKVDARGVTRHGFALNVAPEMEYFAGIIPCGLSQYPVISLADLLGTAPAMETVKTAIVAAFRQTFEKSI